MTYDYSKGQRYFVINEQNHTHQIYGMEFIAAVLAYVTTSGGNEQRKKRLGFLGLKQGVGILKPSIWEVSYTCLYTKSMRNQQNQIL